jgi:hypothetical protein
MDIAFIEEKDKFVVIYLDDVTVFSGSNVEHYEHLKRVFLKRRKFGISLIPKRSLTTMLRKGNEVKWTIESQNSFDQIKKSLIEAPALIILDYSKDFLIFSFASFDTIMTVLLQKNVEGMGHPIYFFI